MLNHREFSPGRERIYWNSNSAGTAENATTVVIQVGPACYNRAIGFAWPADKIKVENLEAMLDAMLETGKGLAKAEIRHVLGIPPLNLR